MNIAAIKKAYPFQAFTFPAGTPVLARRTILFLPGLLFLLCGITLAIPATRTGTIWMLAENKPVEVATFLVLTAGGFFGLNLAWRLHTQGEHLGYVLFYAVFSIGLLLTGLEEIAWGQQFWGFETPASMRELNMQGETTIHNIRGIHGKTEILRFLFGIGGLAGILLIKLPKLSKIATPAILIGFFAIIVPQAAFDVFDDFIHVPKYIEAATSKLAELVELLIAAAAFLYLYFNSIRLTGDKE